MYELIGNVTDNNDLEIIKADNPDINLEKVLYPRFGFCLQSRNYSLNVISIYVEWKSLKNNMIIYLSDNALKTNNGIHYASQKGDAMTIETKESLFYTFQAEMTSYDWRSSSEEDDCENNQKLHQCVEEETSRDLNQKFGCVPTWLSSQNSCTQAYCNETLFWYFQENYVDPYWYLLDTKAKKKCKLPCEQQVFVKKTQEKKHS